MSSYVLKQPDTLNLGDGSTVDVTRLPQFDEKTWGDVQQYLHNNPEIAKSLKTFASNPESVQSWGETRAITEYYNTKVTNGDAEVKSKLSSLHKDAELTAMFEKIKTEGLEAALKYSKDEDLMLKISRKLGGLPSELKKESQVPLVGPEIASIEEKEPASLHEACKMGNVKAVQSYLDKEASIDAKDSKGITPMGYAIGAGYLDIVKLLLKRNADTLLVDSRGNSGLHYAAGYGRGVIVAFLLSNGADVNKLNGQGQTPLKAASMNKQTACIQLLQQRGGQMS
jgi:cytohesin